VECHKNVLKTFSHSFLDGLEQSKDTVEKEMKHAQDELQEQINRANEVIRHNVRDSFREIINALNHRHAVYYGLVQ
jgi:hypothetical protein